MSLTARAPVFKRGLRELVAEAALVARMTNVNTATANELDAVEGLRGHGFEIVRYREERGRFDALRQLDEVPGLSGKVGDAALAQLTV